MIRKILGNELFDCRWLFFLLKDLLFRNVKGALWRQFAFSINRFLALAPNDYDVYEQQENRIKNCKQTIAPSHAINEIFHLSDTLIGLVIALLLGILVFLASNYRAQRQGVIRVVNCCALIINALWAVAISCDGFIISWTARLAYKIALRMIESLLAGQWDNCPVAQSPIIAFLISQ